MSVGENMLNYWTQTTILLVIFVIVVESVVSTVNVTVSDEGTEYVIGFRIETAHEVPATVRENDEVAMQVFGFDLSPGLWRRLIHTQYL